jgi:hypothetical protein
MDAEKIARVCHEANRALTQILKDVPLQPNWDEAPEEMRRSSIQGVTWRLSNPKAPASEQHETWMRNKIADGWTLGDVKDSEKKTHPALIPYEYLESGVKLKDALFTAVVLSLAE